MKKPKRVRKAAEQRAMEQRRKWAEEKVRGLANVVMWWGQALGEQDVRDVAGYLATLNGGNCWWLIHALRPAFAEVAKDRALFLAQQREARPSPSSSEGNGHG